MAGVTTHSFSSGDTIGTTDNNKLLIYTGSGAATLAFEVPPGVTTVTVTPAFDIPLGDTAVICVAELTAKVAVVAQNLTDVAPASAVPVMTTEPPPASSDEVGNNEVTAGMA